MKAAGKNNANSGSVWVALLSAAVAIGMGACALPGTPATRPAEKTVLPASSGVGITLADFEKPDDSVQWIPAAVGSTQPVATGPAQSLPSSPMQRTSLRPQAGLWSMGVSLNEAGEIRRRLAASTDLSAYDTLTVQVAHSGPPTRNGDATAAIVLIDADGTRAEGDAFPISSKWQGISCDLKAAMDEGVDLSRMASIGVMLRPLQSAASRPAQDDPEDRLAVQTDTWRALKTAHVDYGDPKGVAKSFYVESQETLVRVGSVGQFEITLHDRGARVDSSLPGSTQTGPPLPWMEISTGMPLKKVLGRAAPSGLMLLDQSAYSSLSDFREQGPDTAAAADKGVHAGWQLPAISWPASISPTLSQIHWDVVWTSPIGAIVEGKQEVGPYDRLGEPAVLLTWRLMIYQRGEIYVHAQWEKIRGQRHAFTHHLVLALDDNHRDVGIRLDASNPDAQEPALVPLYPEKIREGLTALPHRMQTDAPVAMIARTDSQKDTWWWAAGRMSEASTQYRRYFGAAIVGNSESRGSGFADCMLLVNNPDALTKAASFSQYLVPPKLEMRQGELDKTFPGDADNDGFVEAWGFQAIRLIGGRAVFTIYPQERPLFYPAFLFTVPVAERDTIDLKHSRIMITIDGKLFESPPQFPDESFLLQLPYIIDRPVNIEAIVVKK